MSAAQTMEGVSTRVSTLLVLTSVSVEVDTCCLAMTEIAMVFPEEKLYYSCLMHHMVYNFHGFTFLQKSTKSKFTIFAFNFLSQRFLTLQFTIFLHFLIFVDGPHLEKKS